MSLEKEAERIAEDNDVEVGAFADEWLKTYANHLRLVRRGLTIPSAIAWRAMQILMRAGELGEKFSRTRKYPGPFGGRLNRASTRLFSWAHGQGESIEGWARARGARG